MPRCDTLIRNATLYDGYGSDPEIADVAITADRITALGQTLNIDAATIINAESLALAPGFIDTHTHDDTAILNTPAMLPKLSQGVTTIITGNCGISAAPVTLRGNPPDPMNLLGERSAFQHPTFASYVRALRQAQPAVNVAALVGHTALRSNHMDTLDRAATQSEIAAMRAQLEEALTNGAIGLSTGLAYLSANAATTEEVIALAEPLAAAGAIYTTHLRSETEAVLEAMDEAFAIGRDARVPVLVSHLKCAGIANWGRSPELLHALEDAQKSQPAAADCYPYAAGSSTLDLRQVDERVKITITWSTPYPEAAGKPLSGIAQEWQTSQLEAAKKLQPAGAIYHSISEEDMRRILSHPSTMIGSDGLPLDPHPHPRLWGTFPRVLGRYSRDEKLFPLAQAIYKMTGLPAQTFNIHQRGQLRAGFYADLVLFNPATILDTATFEQPQQPAKGIEAVWVNGTLSYTVKGATKNRAGRFLPRHSSSTRSAA
jgi:N-acyl-D-amino-acid deacylase